MLTDPNPLPTTRVKVRLADTYRRYHSKTFKIPIVSLAEAQKYNPSFGTTILRASTTGENILREPMLIFRMGYRYLVEKIWCKVRMLATQHTLMFGVLRVERRFNVRTPETYSLCHNLRQHGH